MHHIIKVRITYLNAYIDLIFVGEMELHQRLKRSPSVSSSISRNTIGTQTQQQGGSNISTQTLDVPSHRIVYDYLMDVQL